MADAPFTHDLPALFNRSVRRHRGDARGHDVADRCVARGPALQLTLASVIALRKDSDKPATFHRKHSTDVLLRENLERTLDCALRRDRKETNLLLHIEQLPCRFGRFVHHDSPSLRQADCRRMHARSPSARHHAHTKMSRTVSAGGYTRVLP